MEAKRRSLGRRRSERASSTPPASSWCVMIGWVGAASISRQLVQPAVQSFVRAIRLPRQSRRCSSWGWDSKTHFMSKPSIRACTCVPMSSMACGRRLSLKGSCYW